MKTSDALILFVLAVFALGQIAEGFAALHHRVVGAPECRAAGGNAVFTGSVTHCFDKATFISTQE